MFQKKMSKLKHLTRMTAVLGQLLALCLISSFSLISHSEVKSLKDSNITLNADDLMHSNNNETILLNGNVKMLFDGYYFASDQAEVSFKDNKIIAVGNVVLQNMDSYIEAEKITYNYQTQSAIIEGGFIQAGNTSFEGDLVERVDANTYVAENAVYTNCTNCPGTWSISGKKIKATIGGYARIQLPVLKIYNFPILILPALIIPLKSKRQTGLLTPSFDYSSSNKASMTQPFFWAISPHQDSTTTARIFERRGLKLLQEYRYSLSPTSRGQLNLGTFYDREFSFTNVSTDPTFNENRHFLRYIHNLNLKYGIIQRADISYVSDLRYLRDFPEDVEKTGNSSLQNNLSLTKNFDNHHLSALININQNLLKEDPFAKNDKAIHKLPEINYSLIEHKINKTPLLFNLNFNYTRLHRTGDFFDDICDNSDDHDCNDGPSPPSGEKRVDTKGDRVFDPAIDLIRAGQRIDFAPTLSLPFQLAEALDFNASLSWRETLYRFDIDNSSSSVLDNSTSRSYVEPRLSVKTYLSRVYGNKKNSNENLYKHIIEPEIEYSAVNMIQEPDHIFFGNFGELNFDETNQPITDEDFWGENKLQFDYNDRVAEKKLVSFKLTNRIMQKQWVKNEPFYREIFYLKLAQSYDFFEINKEESKPWTRIRANLRVRLKNLQITSDSEYSPYENALTNLSKIRASTDDGKFVQISYQHLLNESDNFSHQTRTEFASVGAGFRSSNLDFAGNLEYSLVKNEIRAWNYSAIFKPPGDCFKFIFTQQQTIDNNDIETSFIPKFVFENSF